MPFLAEPLSLTEDEQQELGRMSQSRSLPAGDVLRARLILMLAEGRSLHRDSGETEHHSSDHFEMEKAFPGTAHRWLDAGTTSRSETERDHAATAS
jgi:hypothetical protein